MQAKLAVCCNAFQFHPLAMRIRSPELHMLQGELCHTCCIYLPSVLPILPGLFHDTAVHAVG